MLLILCLLFIVPALLGIFINSILKAESRMFSLFSFAFGFIVMVGEFALICYPAIYYNIPFHIVCHLTCVLYATECLLVLIWFIKSGRFTPKPFLSKEKLMSWISSPSFWIMLIFCGFQILRLVIFEPFEMRDSKSYNPLIIDIIQSDQLFRINPDNGVHVASVLELPTKFVLSPWYPFISMLAKTSRLHPLIISNTILPGYLLFIHYIIVYSLGLYLFEQKRSSACLYTSLVAFLYEMTLYCHTPTMIKLVWPLWGKGTLSMTVIPAILLLYLVYDEKPALVNRFLFLFVCLMMVTAGCSMSTMAALELPLEIGILGLIWTIRHRSARPLIYSIASCVPVGFYVIVYYYLSTIQI